MNQLSSGTTALLERLAVAQLDKEFPTLLDPECPLPCLEDPAMGLSPEPDDSNLQILILLS